MNIIEEEISNEIKVKRSRFIAHIKPVKSVEEAKEYINKITKENKNANHNCWTYNIGIKGDVFHYSDNGEPSGTAGLPMFRVLQKYELTNIVVVVTRYFGGIKLGIRGLIDAYGKTVEETLKLTKIIELVDYKYQKISTSYQYSEILKYKLHSLKIIIEKIEYSENVLFLIKYKSDDNKIELELNSLKNSGKINIL